MVENRITLPVPVRINKFIEEEPVKIQVRLIVIFSVILSLLGGLVIMVWLIYQGNQSIAEAEVRRYKSHILADRLRQSSDDLTRMARTYVIDREPGL